MDISVQLALPESIRSLCPARVNRYTLILTYVYLDVCRR